MRKSNHHGIRMLLQQYHDGLTVTDIAERMEKSRGAINRALPEMPDAYIDRWTSNKSQWAAVWCVIVPPENCPKPKESPLEQAQRHSKLRRVEQRELGQVLHGFVSANAGTTRSD
jgi:hypothetical protein